MGKLQQAHEDLHSQSELARNREALLYQIEKAVSESNGLSPAETLEKVKALVTSRA